MQIYEWFYTGQFDRMEAKFKAHEHKPVGGAEAGARMADRQDYILVMLGRGMAHEILHDFPDLEREDIRACLDFAADRERKLVSVPRA